MEDEDLFPLMKPLRDDGLLLDHLENDNINHYGVGTTGEEEEEEELPARVPAHARRSRDIHKNNNNNKDNNNSSQNAFTSLYQGPVDSVEVLRRIERVVHVVLLDLEDEGRLPRLEQLRDEDDNKNNDNDSSRAGDGTEEDEDEEAQLLMQTGTGQSSNHRIQKEFNLQQSRSMTSIVLILSFCHNLLRQGKTTTVREVYYFYVTHFRHQKECDAAIQEAAVLLNVPRDALGLRASPKGWYCGDLQITCTMPNGQESTSDARALTSLHGAPIDSVWLHMCHEDEESEERPESSALRRNNSNFRVSTTAARCILVIEKEGIYNRLAEDRFYDVYPCILMTAKGFPDLSSRAMVHYLHRHLDIPVWGLCDCNPFGILVLHTYFRGSNRRGRMDGGARFSVPIQWMGLRPSQVEALRQKQKQQDEESDDEKNSRGDSTALLPPLLPPQVFQELTPLDRKRLDDTLMGDFGLEWTGGYSERRMEELECMSQNGYKVELEALHWMGMDFFNDWLGSMFDHQQEKDDADNPEQEVEDIRDVI